MKKAPVFHPFLFSLFPILALYAYNIKSIPVPLGELAGPLLVSFVCAVVLFLAFRIALKNPAKAGLLVSLLLLWFLSFGHIAGLVAVWTEGIFNRSLFFATAVFVGLAAFLIVRSRRGFRGLTRVLNVVSATLVVLNLASAAQTLALRPHVVVEKEVKVSRQTSARPNIYYVVFDAYTRADILQEIYSYDNREFLSALEARGFYIATKSYANYGFTYHSLASSLNFTYLDLVAKDNGSASSDQEPLYRMIRENRAMAFLKSQGYRLFCFPPSFKPGDIKAVDSILSRSPQPPIIILQGDHGSRAYTDFDHPEASYLKESLAILNAYYLPGGGRELVYPEISPVNTFRLIFKHYFGADLDLLEDRSAWCTWRRPYIFIPFRRDLVHGDIGVR